MTPWPHGGDLTEAIRRFGGAPDDWLDLSTGINPKGWPVPALPQHVFEPLPRTDRRAALHQAAKAHYGLAPGSRIASAAGAQAIIDLLPMLAPGPLVGILGPTYSAYETVFTGEPFRPEQMDSFRDLAGSDVAIVVNPNNPGGRDYEVKDLLRLADDVGLLIVDEAFRDMAPERSLCPRRLPENLLVLRSFGKFFGLAGVRLGFAFGHRTIIEALDYVLGPWPVSGPAMEIGIQALGDKDWIAKTRARLEEDSARLAALLEQAGFTIVANTDLFVTAEKPSAHAIHRRLAKAHIWVRQFDYNATWLRFGLPGSAADWERLEAALRS